MLPYFPRLSVDLEHAFCDAWPKLFSKRHRKPSVCDQLFKTSPNSPILSAASNGQAVRQAAAPFACMVRLCACVSLTPLLLLAKLSLLLLCEYRHVALLLLLLLLPLPLWCY